jgi:hypothetical protein
MHRARLFLLALLLTILATHAHAQSKSFETQVREQVDAMLREPVEGSTNAMRVRHAELERFANTVAAKAGPRQFDSMSLCEGALGVCELLLGARASDAGETLQRFADHPEFMVELGLLYSEKDDAKGVLDLANRLMDERGDQIDQYPALAAALCVVHDMQGGKVYSRWVNEHTPESSAPLEIFDFFVGNARTMSIRPDTLPAIALVYVVDVTETPQQLQWAHDRFRSSPMIKDRFFEIEYDYQHFQQNKPKRVTSEAGEYNLEKIKRYGGVCADQAYYAMSVAKACGIPSAYVIARGADVSHAWVGFVEQRGRRTEWNFDAGRYSDYQNLRGNLVNPQTRESISDGRAGVLADAMSSRNEEVLASLAAARVVQRMSQQRWQLDEDAELDGRGNIRSMRTDSVEDRLTLLRATLSKCAGVPSAWDRVVSMADRGDLSEKQMDVWGRAVMQLAGRQHQDFAYDFLVRLISTIEEPQRQHEMWEWAFGQFRARPDLAAGVRFKQGELWASNDNLDFAWRAYNDVVARYINDGPQVVNALSSMDRLLADNKKGDEMIPILEDAGRRVTRPDDMSTQFAVQSNYYRIHRMLAKAYERAGRRSEAKQVRDMLGR